MHRFQAANYALRYSARALRFHLAPLVRRPVIHEIAAGYRHRDQVGFFDDTGFTDEWQREVHEEAASLMLEHRLATVLDVGCGSGYKLVHTLGQFDTTGSTSLQRLPT